MTLNQLKYVVEVSRAGSINKASSNLYLSQSLISTAISRLEQEIGHVIFIRGSRGVTLTPFGKTFVAYISAIQTQLDQIDSLIQQVPNRYSYTLAVASTGFFFLGPIFSQIFEEYRSLGVRIESYEGPENDVADMVANQIHEVGIVRLWSYYKDSYLKQLHSKRLQYTPIEQLNMAITIGPRNPLFYSESDSVSREAIANYPSVTALDVESGPYSDIFKRLNLPKSRNRFITTSRALIYELLNHTDCYYLNSDYPIHRNDDSTYSPYANLRTLKLEDPGVSSEIGWIKREGAVLSPISAGLIARINDYFSDINGN